VKWKLTRGLKWLEKTVGYSQWKVWHNKSSIMKGKKLHTWRSGPGGKEERSQTTPGSLGGGQQKFRDLAKRHLGVVC